LGQLSFPPLAKVYLDTAPIIYSVEKHQDYWQILISLWNALKAKEIEVFTSELTLLETLVQPIRQNNQSLIAAYESLLTKTDVKLEPINLAVLRQAADLRAAQNLKTPDAVHASTAIAANCSYFVTNDNGFKRLSNFNVVVLSEII
jgi:predicted nucleic acid-binding protein